MRETNDAKQFARQVDQANDVPGSPCEAACGDAGELGKEITVIAPSRKQALHHPKDYPFDKRRFVCYAGTDTYTCPEGHRLRFSFTQKRGKRRYRMENSNACRRYPSLRAVHKITPVIIRLRSEAVRLKLETRYSEESSRIIYKRRKTKIELFFGRIKRNLKTGPFLLRGTGGAAAEVSILALRFNLTRVTDIPGVKKLIGAFRSMRMAPA